MTDSNSNSKATQLFQHSHARHLAMLIDFHLVLLLELFASLQHRLLETNQLSFVVDLYVDVARQTRHLRIGVQAAGRVGDRFLKKKFPTLKIPHKQNISSIHRKMQEISAKEIERIRTHLFLSFFSKYCMVLAMTRALRSLVSDRSSEACARGTPALMRSRKSRALSKVPFGVGAITWCRTVHCLGRSTRVRLTFDFTSHVARSSGISERGGDQNPARSDESPAL